MLYMRLAEGHFQWPGTVEEARRLDEETGEIIPTGKRGSKKTTVKTAEDVGLTVYRIQRK